MYFSILIILFILLIYFTQSYMRHINTDTYEDYLYGFWTADESFCEKSGIVSMLIFIGAAETAGSVATRTCYIVIMDGLCNQGFTLVYPLGCAGPRLGPYKISAEVQFDGAELEDIWPENVNISVDIETGTMKIYDDDEVYAEVIKQHDITNNAKAMEVT
jgi:hypothetical protein